MRFEPFKRRPDPAPPPPQNASALPLDQTLLTLGGEGFTIRDACQGVQVFGATGSGKTSGSGRYLAMSYLAYGMGGLVLCAKPEERQLWENLARLTAREDDLIIFDATGDRYRFNFINYEKHAGGGVGLTANTVQLLTEVVRAIEREERDQGEKPFWRNALRQLTTAVIELASFAGLDLRFDLLSDIVRSGPQNPHQWEDPAWQEQSVCYLCVKEAEGLRNQRDSDAELDFQKCRAYWTGDFARLHPETRSSIVLSFTMVVDMFNTSPLRKLLSSETTITPDDTFRGKIIILDLPIQTYYRAGRIAQFVWKYVWQRAVLRRQTNEHSLPVFLWCDESQNFIGEFDPEFQAVARSAKACTVYLTQNLGMYKKVLGEGSDNAVEAFLGNLQTKIFHQNSSTETNEWAADLFAKDWMAKHGTQSGWSPGGATAGGSVTPEMQHQVPPITFTRLATGGPAYGFAVEAIIYKGGAIFGATGKNFLKLQFSQQ